MFKNFHFLYGELYSIDLKTQSETLGLRLDSAVFCSNFPRKLRNIVLRSVVFFRTFLNCLLAILDGIWKYFTCNHFPKVTGF